MYSLHCYLHWTKCSILKWWFQTWNYMSTICKQIVNIITKHWRHKLKLGSWSFLAFFSSKIKFLSLLEFIYAHNLRHFSLISAIFLFLFLCVGLFLHINHLAKSLFFFSLSLFLPLKTHVHTYKFANSLILGIHVVKYLGIRVVIIGSENWFIRFIYF